MKTNILILAVIILLASCSNNSQSKQTTEMLDKIVVLEMGLENALERVENNNLVIYDEFEKAYHEYPVKVKPWKEKAFEIRNKANEIYDVMLDIKVSMLTKGEEIDAIIGDGSKISVEPRAIAKKDNTDIPYKVIFEDGNGKKIKKMFDEFKNQLFAMLNEIEAKETLLSDLDGYVNTYDHIDPRTSGKITWESYYFENTQLITAIAVISKLQTDIRIAESLAINYLICMISADYYPFTNVEIMVVPQSNIIKHGENYEAEIFLAAYDSFARNKVWIGDFNHLSNEVDESKGFWLDENLIKSGKAIYNVEKPKPGIHKYKGFVQLNTPRGPKNYEFEEEYEVLE